MDDLRQKLFPIFLKEAEKNLGELRQFLGRETLLEANAEELEAAFRAAHTLKGTANLVKAESICKIARRLERMLEKHYEAGTIPTPVEHEALKLAVDWLAPLVSALQGDLEEPTFFVAEALQALDLAEAFPGRTPLVELLDSQEQQRAPQLDDPFAGDPDLLSDEATIEMSAFDPFADDPGFGVEIDLVSRARESREVGEPLDDPFGDDADFTAAESYLARSDMTPSEELQGAESLPYDPFADDALDLADEPEPDTAELSAIESVAQGLPADPFAEDDYELDGLADSEQRSIEEPAEEEIASESVELPAIEDPFAEDDYELDAAAVSAPGAILESLSDEVRTETEAVGSIEDPFAEDDFDLEVEPDSIAESLAETDDTEVDSASEQEVADEEPFAVHPLSAAKRAEEIAESLLLPDRETAPRKDYTCCVFSIGGRDYYLPIKQMKEIADLPQLLPLPLAPPMVSGLVNLRGQVLPVINLSILNQHQQDEVRVQRRLVIAEQRGESLAFLADGVPYLAEEFNGEKIDMTEFLSLYRIRGSES